MKKFVVERVLPGASNLTPQELQEISAASCKAIVELGGSYHWIQSFITDDKIYCIYIAESEEAVRAHAQLAGVPVNTIAEVKAIIDPLTANPVHK